MKKKNVFNCLLIVLTLCLVITGCGKDNEDNSKSKKSKDATLREFIDNHQNVSNYCDSEYCPNFYFSNDEFKCSALDDNNITLMNNYYMVLDNNKVYEITLEKDKLYSNDEQCKLHDMDINIKEIKGKYAIDDKGTVYNIDLGWEDILFNTIENKTTINILKDETTKNILDYKNEYIDDEDYTTYYILKNDNKIYKTKYKTTWGKPIKLISEDVYIDGSEYGNIIDITISNKYDDPEKNEKEITSIISDKGYYYLKEIKTKECEKYEDVKCENKLVESELAKKYWKDIKFINNYLLILKDKGVTSTSILQYELDDDEK